MAVVYTPTLRGRRLALELRTLRERAKVSQVDAAHRLAWSKSKLSRIETAQTKPDDEDVKALLQMYGLDVERHDAIIQLLRESWQRGWWTHYGSLFRGMYVMLEEQAPDIRLVEHSLVPGLFQTPDYARAVIHTLRPGDDSHLEKRVEARIHRQHVLDRANPPQVHAVIDEAALRRPVGGAEVMRRQISALCEATVQRPNVTIQVVPLDVPVHAGVDGAFSLFTFPETPGLDVGHSEWRLGEWYAESVEEVTDLRMAFESVSATALSPEETLRFLVALT